MSFLDKPVFGNLKLTRWTAIYLALMVFILLTRFWALGARGYEHDESIHAWESWKLATGQGYVHNPVYHGPFLYHLTALIFVLFGDNNTTARLGTALGGVIITLMPLFMRQWLGKKGVLVATLLMAISPVLMARSRYIWHDQWTIVFNLMLLVAILRYTEQRRPRDLYILVAALVLGYTGKSTSFIAYAIYGTFLLGLYIRQLWREHLRPWTDSPFFDILLVIGTLSLPSLTPFPILILGGNPADYTSAGIVRSAAVFTVFLAIGVGIGSWWNWRRWLVCAGIYYGIFVPLFTTMFTNGNGLATGLVGMLGYWLTQQEVKRGGQPLHYYAVLMSLYEFLPLLTGIGGTIYYALRRHRGGPEASAPEEFPTWTAAPAPQERQAEYSPPAAIPLVLLLIYWTWLAFVIYTWAGEKMPWLTMHLVVPLDLLAAWTIVRLLEADWQAIRAKGGLWLLLCVPLVLYATISVLSGSPFRGTTLEQLNQTMAWLAALGVGAIVLALSWHMLRRLGRRETLRLSVLALLLVLLGATVRIAWMVTYTNAAMATELLVYAQGSPDDALVDSELQDMSRRLYGDLSMKVAYDDDSSWPFVWYLRDYTNAQFYGKKPGGPFDAEVVIVGPANEAGVKPLLGSKYYRRQYRLIWWPNQDWYMGMTHAKFWTDLVTDPSARARFWNVVWNRKYQNPDADGVYKDVSTTSWPFVHTFALYVRRDVAAQLWDYGPETLAAGPALPGDEYVEKWKERAAIAAWGSMGSGPGQLRAPKGLALDAQGNLYVADSQNHRIVVFDASGQPLREFGSEGTQAGQFKEPWGVAVAPNGEIYVADTWNHRVQVFDAQGKWKRMWGQFLETQEANGPGDSFYGPRDLAFDAQGNLYVSDTGNKRIIKYDPKGQMIGAVGGQGDGEGQFQEPVGIALDKDGLLYVADTWNQRIQVFDSQLSAVRQWPVVGWEGLSVVNKPYLAVDGAGNVYAGDPEAFRALKFDSQGKLLAAWGQSGSDLSSMNLPTGIKVDEAGRIYVADSENNRILVFAGGN